MQIRELEELLEGLGFEVMSIDNGWEKKAVISHDFGRKTFEVSIKDATPSSIVLQVIKQAEHQGVQRGEQRVQDGLKSLLGL